jgi:hypothetical protein
MWVKLWLGILLPEYGDPIRFQTTAETKLQELRASSKSEVDQEFRPVYQRLWDVHRAGELAEYQTRLFHLVLCLGRDRTTDLILSALRVHKDSVNARLNTKDVKHIFANFLVENETHHLEFTHGTAENFIRNMEATDGFPLPGVAKMFDGRSNHLSVADTCLSLIADLNHPAWKDAIVKSEDNDWMTVSELQANSPLSVWFGERPGSPLPFTPITVLKAFDKWSNFAHYALSGGRIISQKPT